MSGCTVTYRGDDETLPHSVVLVDGPLQGIPAFLARHGVGHYDILIYQTSIDSNNWQQRYRFRFSDADTAFWFKLTFT